MGIFVNAGVAGVGIGVAAMIACPIASARHDSGHFRPVNGLERAGVAVGDGEQMFFGVIGQAVSEGLHAVAGGDSKASPSPSATPSSAPSNSASPKASKSPDKQQSPSSLECISQLTPAQAVGQVLMPGVYANQLVAAAPVVRRNHLGSVVLMTSPANPYDGSIKLFKKATGAWVATDEEGGIVQRFRMLGALKSPAKVSARSRPSDAQRIIANHAKKMKKIGIDEVFGPLADVNPPQGSGVLGTRAFVGNAYQVTAWDAAYIAGFRDGGIVPTLKHFPGLGSANFNSDLKPAVVPGLPSLNKRDLVPYRRLKSLDVPVMVGNMLVGPHDKVPASENKAIITGLLRNQLGYKNNVLYTDSLLAHAIHQPLSVAAVNALMAGADIVVFTDPDGEQPMDVVAHQILKTRKAVEAAVRDGQLPRAELNAKIGRILSMRHVTATC